MDGFTSFRTWVRRFTDSCRQARRKCARAPRRSIQPQLEALEERLAPTTTPASGLFLVPASGGKVTFTMTGESTAYSDEVGLFRVDDASGKLNGVAPSDSGYLAEFKSTTRTTVFTQSQSPSSSPTTELSLEPGRYYAFYIVQDATYSSWLSANASNDIDPANLPNVFFSLTPPNPDSATSHFTRADQVQGKVQFSLEDLDYGNRNSSGGTVGGEPDFNDIVFTITPPAGPVPQGQDCGCGCPGPLNASEAGTPAGPSNMTAGGVHADGTIGIGWGDLASFGLGFWGQGLSWTNGTGYASTGVSGSGMVNPTMPHLMQIDGDNVIAIVTGGTAAQYFDLAGGSYTARYVSKDLLTHDTGAHTFTFTDSTGARIEFYDYDTGTPAAQRGQIKSFTDPAGHVASTTYDGNGMLTEVQRSTTSGSDTITESYAYTYVASGANAGLMETVTLRRKVNAGSWATVRQAAYAYYVNADANGSDGDLKSATLKDASGTTLDVTFFRYYESDSATGYTHALKYAFGPASYARAVAAGYDPASATDGQVSSYADHYLEYEWSGRVSKHVVQGEGCSSCSGGLGTYTYTYTASGLAPGANTWALQTIVTLPDGNQNIVYTNAGGQVMLDVFKETATGTTWQSFYKYDSDGRVTLVANPSAVTGYDDAYADLLHSVRSNYQYLSDSTGLITVIDYYTSTTATETSAGGVAGYVQDHKLQQGETGTAIIQDQVQYFAHTGGARVVHPIATSTVYRNTDGTGGQTTSYAYTWFASSAQPQSITVTYPTVTTAQNGPNSADVESTYFDTYGRPTWTKDADGFIHHMVYDAATGAVTESMVDVDLGQYTTALTGSFTDADIGSPSPAGSSSYNSGTDTWTVTGGGQDIWGTADDFHYTYQTLDGDGTFIVRVASIQNTGTYAKVGLMIRESTAANSKQAMINVQPGGSVEFARRTSTGGSTTGNSVSTGGAPIWLQLAHNGNTFTAYYSTNGVSWTLLGTATISMSSSVLVGLAVNANHNGTGNTSTFTDLGYRPDVPAGWNTPTGGGLNLTTSYETDALGRTTKVTLPAGNITYVTYNDADHETRVYQGWDTGTDAPTGPTQVYREDRAGSYVESLTMSATPNLASGRPDGTESISGLQTLSRTYISIGGQLDHVDEYFDLSGLTYSTSTTLGTENTNFYRTRYSFNDQGLLSRVQLPTGTIERTEYDALGRFFSTWVGTDDTPTSGYWSPSNLTGTDMVKVSEAVYDNGGVGDSNLTQMTEYPGGGAAARVSQWYFDWRNRVVAAKSGVEGSESTSLNRPIAYFEYDNLDEVFATSVFDGDSVTISDGNSDGVPDKPSSSLLRSYSTASFDEQGRVYRTNVYSVDPSDGSVSTSSLATNLWYNRRGDVIRVSTPGSASEEMKYDGAERLVKDWWTDGAAGTGWSNAGTPAGDRVYEQTENQYDSNGNVVFTIYKQRFDNLAATLTNGQTLGELGDPGTVPYARVYYAAAYYDLADRLTASVDVGTNGGTAYTRPGSVPSRSDTVLVQDVAYNAAGWVEDVTDPRGIVGRTLYDNLGRVLKTIENYVDGTPSAADDRTTAYTYDGDDNVLTVQAQLPGGDVQTTQYVYGVTAGSGSDITSLAQFYKDKNVTVSAWTGTAYAYQFVFIFGWTNTGQRVEAGGKK